MLSNACTVLYLIVRSIQCSLCCSNSLHSHAHYHSNCYCNLTFCALNVPSVPTNSLPFPLNRKSSMALSCVRWDSGVSFVLECGGVVIGPTENALLETLEERASSWEGSLSLDQKNRCTTSTVNLCQCNGN